MMHDTCCAFWIKRLSFVSNFYVGYPPIFCGFDGIEWDNSWDTAYQLDMILAPSDGNLIENIMMNRWVFHQTWLVYAQDWKS